MTPILNLHNIKPFQCAKPGCTRRPIERHHRGSERMWLRHFRHRRRSAKYKDFRDRYYEYRAEDTVSLCLWHHEEISRTNLALIKTHVALNGYVPCHDYSWDEAFALIAKLRAICDEWVKVETPGIEPRPRKQTL